MILVDRVVMTKNRKLLHVLLVVLTVSTCSVAVYFLTVPVNVVTLANMRMSAAIYLPAPQRQPQRTSLTDSTQQPPQSTNTTGRKPAMNISDSSTLVTYFETPTSPTLAAVDILHNHRIVINEPGACVNVSKLHLLVGVMSAPGEFNSRRAIRETWGRDRVIDGANVVILYFVGQSRGNNLTEHELIRSESSRHRDMIQHDYIDSYDNLTLKSVALLEWTNTYCNMTRYLLKADTDVYVNIRNMVTYVKEKGHRRDLIGSFQHGARPIRDGNNKWHALDSYRERVYPDYVSGPAYAMSADVARELYRGSFQVPFFNLEDIYVTGLCARAVGVRARHMPLIDIYSGYKVEMCRYGTLIAMHYILPQHMYEIHRWLQEHPGVKC